MDKYSFLSWNEEEYRMHAIADGARTYEVYRKAPEENAFNGFAKKCCRQACFISASPAANFRNEIGISSGKIYRLSVSDPAKLVFYYDNVCIVI